MAKQKNNNNITNSEILKAVNDYANKLDKRFDGVDKSLDGVDKRSNKIEATMVTKD